MCPAFGFGAVGGHSVQVLEARGASARCFEILLRKPTIPLKGGKVPTELKGDVGFLNVSFAYPSRPDITVLEKFSLDVPANSTAALVGASGSGKSTAIALLQRFYDVGHGQVMIDGVDIKRLDPSWLRANIGLVLQGEVGWAPKRAATLYQRWLKQGKNY